MTKQDVAKYKGVFTPDEILRRKDISLLEKLILAEIVHFAEKGCYLSNAEFARRFGQSRNGVCKAISRLKQMGEISDIGKDCYHRKLLPKRQLSCRLDDNQSANSVVGSANSVVGSTPKSANSGRPKGHRRRNIKGQKKKAPSPSVFQKPTIEQLKEWIIEKGYSVDADEFYLKYDANGWRVNKDMKPMESWQLTMIRWQQNEVRKAEKDGRVLGTPPKSSEQKKQYADAKAQMECVAGRNESKETCNVG